MADIRSCPPLRGGLKPKHYPVFGHTCAFSPTSPILAIGNDQVTLVNLSTGTYQYTDRDPVVYGTYSITFSRDGLLVAGITNIGTIAVSDPHTGASVYTLECQGQVSCCAFSPDATCIVAGIAGTAGVFDADSGMHILDVRTGAIVHSQPQCLDFPTNCDWSATGTYVASTTMANVAIWNVHSNVWYTLNCRGGRSCAFSPNNDTLLATALSDRTVCLWNADSGVCLHILSDHDSWIAKCVFSRSGQYLASFDKAIKIWDVDTGNCVFVQNYESLICDSTCGNFSSDDALFAVTSASFGTYVYNLPRRLHVYVTVLCMILVGNCRDRRLRLPDELWDWISEQDWLGLDI